MNRRRVVGVALCCGLPAAMMLLSLEQVLLARGVLNTKDLPPIVGEEPGTVRDYLLNVWHWDVAILLLFAISLPCLVAGIRLLGKPSAKPAASEDAA